MLSSCGIETTTLKSISRFLFLFLFSTASALFSSSIRSFKVQNLLILLCITGSSSISISTGGSSSTFSSIISTSNSFGCIDCVIASAFILTRIAAYKRTFPETLKSNFLASSILLKNLSVTSITSIFQGSISPFLAMSIRIWIGSESSPLFLSLSMNYHPPWKRL